MRPALRNGLLFAVFAILVLSIYWAGDFLSSPAEIPVRADIVLVLGGDNGDRVVMANKIYMQGYAPRVMLTGLENSPSITRVNYLNWRVEFLIEQRISFDSIILESEAGNSWEEAVNTLAILKLHGWKRVIVVSDPPHLRRLSWVWSKVFTGSDKEFVLVSSEPSWWSPFRWWTNDQSGLFVVMEYIKLGYYFFKYGI